MNTIGESSRTSSTSTVTSLSPTVPFSSHVDPSLRSCDIDYDPFLYMQDNGKKCESCLLSRFALLLTQLALLDSFVVSLYEYRDTITTLWDTTKGPFPSSPRVPSGPS
jgi:hypothetical protein